MEFEQKFEAAATDKDSRHAVKCLLRDAGMLTAEAPARNAGALLLAASALCLSTCGHACSLMFGTLPCMSCTATKGPGCEAKK